MLLKRATLEGIRSGAITLAFRRWKRPTVKAGGRLRTAIGELAIEAVDVVTLKSITDAHARRAGFGSRAELVAALRGREGKVHRVRLRLAGADTRIALRAKSRLSRTELDEALERLARMDAHSKDGPWTRRVLRAIDRAPGERAADLAAALGLERLPFKQRVRRLKDLGLTESLAVGYRVSPRGRAVLKHLGRS
jgi:hypothetical protein